MLRWTQGLLVMSIMGLAATASAQAGSLQAPSGGEARVVVGAELGFGGTSSDVGGDIFGIGPLLYGRFALDPSLSFGLDWLFMHGSLSVGDESESGFLVGNPFLSALYRVNGAVTVGGGLSLPVASGDSVGDVVAVTAAGGLRGAEHPWLYAFDTLGMVGLLRVEHALGSAYVGGDGAFGLLIDTGDGRDATDVVIEFAPELGFSFDGGRVGARFRAVVVPTADGDNAQTSLEPFVRFDVGAAAFLTGRFTFNLDDPFGTSFEDAGFWALHLGIGARL